MKIVLALSVLLLFLAGCTCLPPTTQPAPKPTPTLQPSPASREFAKRLAEQFCPVVYLKGEGEASENYEPEPIEIMVEQALLRDIADVSFSQKATLPNLLQWSTSIYYLDLAGLGPATSSLTEYKLSYDQLKDKYRPTLYTRVKERAGDGYTIVQYWIFYYFNDWRNFHEGDWELVQLSFPGQTAKELLDSGKEPLFAAYSQHQAGQKMSWSDMKLRGLVEVTHPVVYVARGSHANYFSAGNYWSGLDFDSTGESSWKVINPGQISLVLLPEIEEAGEELQWLNFKGRWGEYLGFSVSVLSLQFGQQGPFGPPWNDKEQIVQKWNYPDRWAAGLPEYPEPFWTFLLKLPGDWFNRAVFSLFSPADIHVYDSLGRHVGVNEKGEIDKQIPGAVYITPEGTQYKTIIIPGADISQKYTLIIKGTGSGTMELKAQVPDARNKTRPYLEYTNVPVTATTTARVNIVADRVVKLELDSNGDGIFELESGPGKFAVKKAVQSGLKANIDIEPDTLDFASITREPIIAYIELPEGYNPKSIDVNTVRLLKDIPAWEGVIDIVDHDQDGVPELLVRFDRRLLFDYLERIKQLEGKVSLTISGTVNGRPFEGTAAILIVPVKLGSGQ